MDAGTIYKGSDGEATKAMYDLLENLGAWGVVAVNLFRAQKNSARAKVYHGGIRGKGRFKDMAYDRKGWSLKNLCAVLKEHACHLGICYGWGTDASQAMNPYVLYVDTPQGQVSFHSPVRYEGPEYKGKWDGTRLSAERIIAFTQSMLDRAQLELFV